MRGKYARPCPDPDPDPEPCCDPPVAEEGPGARPGPGAGAWGYKYGAGALMVVAACGRASDLRTGAVERAGAYSIGKGPVWRGYLAGGRGAAKSGVERG